jgi:hypothetical protein
MGLAHSPSIVTDGLKVCFDAANPKSYPGSGTTWYDLSGNDNHGTLLNSPTFNSDKGGCFVFDGTNDRISFTLVATKTVCFWGRLASGFADLAALVASSANGDGSLRVRSEGDGRFRSPGDTNDYQKSGYAPQLMMNGEANLAVSNGNLVVPHGRTMLQDYYVGALGPGRGLRTISHDFMNRRYKGRVYAVLLYNRHLTFSELLQNYHAFKGRFGL